MPPLPVQLVEELAARLVGALVGVGAGNIALRLQEVGGQAFTAVAIVEGECGGEGRDRHAVEHGLGDGAAPGILAALQQAVEIIGEQQVGELGVGGVGSLDFAEEDAADDAAFPPHHGDGTVIQVPVVFLGGLGEEHEALGVADDLGGEKRLADVLDEGLLVAGDFHFGTGQDLGGFGAVILHGAEAARVNRFADEGDGHAEIERADAGPFAGALLAGGIENLVEGLPRWPLKGCRG